MNKILRYSLVALMAMVMGNVYADEVTMKYTGSTTTNMTGENDAALVGHDASAWSVVGAKGAHEQFPGLNKAGDIRLYWKAEGGSTITVTSLTGATINSIKITFTGETYSNISVTVGGKAVSGTGGAYDINSTSFVLGNANTESVQVRFTELVINYTPAGGGGGETGDAEKWDVTSLTFNDVVVEEGGKAVPVLQDMTTTDNPNAVFIIPESTHVFDEGTYPDNMNRVYEWLDANGKSTYAGVLKEYTFTASTTNISLKAVSTPNADAKLNESWQMSTNDAEAINTDDFPAKFTKYIKPKNGDPSLGSYDFYDKNSDGKSTHRVTNDFWKPGCGSLPVKGCYYEFTTKSAGTLLVAVCMWKNLPQRPLYVIDESTAADGYTVLAPSKLTVEGVLQNNGWDGWHGKVYHKFTVGDDYLLYEDNGEGTLELAPNSRTFFGYVKFEVEANKTYMVMNPNNQMGLYGFQFTPSGDPSGVETIKTNKVWNADAPMYNLSGQKVDKSYKGIVIQNGRKFFNK